MRIEIVEYTNDMKHRAWKNFAKKNGFGEYANKLEKTYQSLKASRNERCGTPYYIHQQKYTEIAEELMGAFGKKSGKKID